MAPGGAGPAARRNRIVVAAPLAVFVLALVPRLIGIGHPPYIDELYNVLAAKSLVAHGTLEIGQGVPYRRGALHTLIIAGMFRLFGADLVVARLPGVIFGAALVVVLFVWLRSTAGRLEAWIAALLMATSPTAIALSQIGRFYPAQVLAFWTATMLVYRNLLDPRTVRPSVPGLVLAGLAFAVALHLQPVSAVGLLGVGIAVLLLRGREAWRLAAARRLPRWLLAPGIGLAVGLGFVLLRATRRASRMFLHADLWAYEHRSDLLFYHDRFLEHWGALWLVVPLLLFAALRKRTAPAVLAGAVFLLAFGFHSVAAWKNERYVHYATPALFAIIGLGTGAVLETVRSWISRSPDPAGRRVRRRVATGLIAIAGVAVVLTAGAPRTSWRMMTLEAPDRPDPYPRSDWEAARPLLQPVLDSSAVLIGSADLKALYYLGRLDYDLSADHLFDGERFVADFTPQAGTGTPVIRSPGPLRQIIACVPSGLIVIERDHWRAPDGVEPETADLIESAALPVSLPDRLQLLAFRWRPGLTAPLSAPSSGACADLPAR